MRGQTAAKRKAERPEKSVLQIRIRILPTTTKN
jgi:hypothetical protein